MYELQANVQIITLNTSDSRTLFVAPPLIIVGFSPVSPLIICTVAVVAFLLFPDSVRLLWHPNSLVGISRISEPLPSLN